MPLLWAEGAGAAGQQALGTAVFGGMIASTLLAVLFVPVFFLLLQTLSEWWKPMVLTPVHRYPIDDECVVDEAERPMRRKALRAAGTR
jgi:hypothetical protein